MIPQPVKFSWSKKEQAFFSLLGIIGIICFIVGFGMDKQRTWTAFLVNYYFWFCLSLAGIFFTALQYLSGSRWSASIRRIPEMFKGYWPVAAVLTVVLYFGFHDLYEWTHTEFMENDHLLHGKIPYLNTGFVVFRLVALFFLLYFLGGKIIRNSLKQDETGKADLTLKNIKYSAIFIFLFGWLFTFFSVDLIKSLQPHWFSTIFGVYCWAGLFSSGLAMIILWCLLLKKRGSLDVFLTEDHLHDLGKLLFAFIVFWAYTGFSQYMLIWYSNLPEETFYFLDRQQGGWENIGLFLMVGKFAFPFLFLIGRKAKRNTKALVFICIYYLITQWIEVYWLVYPPFFKAPVFGLLEVGMTLGFLGVFLLAVGRALSKVSPVAVKDPWIHDALHYHQ